MLILLILSCSEPLYSFFLSFHWFFTTSVLFKHARLCLKICDNSYGCYGVRSIRRPLPCRPSISKARFVLNLVSWS
uniref:Putative secreted protein n=1 Tax=Anopheles darlingi TaxID=43151 RepID=A0A2M4DE40_ANODA